MGVPSEMELAFAGMHRRSAPMLDHDASLPVPQREALRTALGLNAGPVPGQFLVGLAALGLLLAAASVRWCAQLRTSSGWIGHRCRH